MSTTDEAKQFIPLNIAVLTISDTRSLADDKSGSTLADRLTAAGHHLAAREIIVDDVDAIRVIIRRWIADPGVDAIITTGGTGFTGRDVTPEAVEPLFEKRMDGFSIAFHMLSHAKIGASTVQSRATAGVAGATFIFCLPGSPGACRDAWDGILADQFEPGLLIDFAGGDQHALGPQRDPAIAAGLRERDAFADQPPAQSLSAPGRVDQQQAQLRYGIRMAHQKYRADLCSLDIGDPATFPRRVE